SQAGDDVLLVPGSHSRVADSRADECQVVMGGTTDWSFTPEVQDPFARPARSDSIPEGMLVIDFCFIDVARYHDLRVLGGVLEFEHEALDISTNPVGGGTVEVYLVMVVRRVRIQHGHLRVPNFHLWNCAGLLKVFQRLTDDDRAPAMAD